MRTTEDTWGRHPFLRVPGSAGGLVLCCLALSGLLLTACSDGSRAASVGSPDATKTAGAHMGGPSYEVHISQAAIKATPLPWNLKTPESAVRSYLDWTTYSYRIAQADFSKAIMGGDENVRVDSYVQYNIEKRRLIDQKLVSLTLGTPITRGNTTLLPAREQWSYVYRTTAEGNKTIAGPYSASYDTTYTVVKSKDGLWRVESVKAAAQGIVK